jgi:hypothetical protein
MIALIAVVGLSHRSKQIDRSGDVATTPFQLGNVLKLLFNFPPQDGAYSEPNRHASSGF